jgi:hypothetical protein
MSVYELQPQDGYELEYVSGDILGGVLASLEGRMVVTRGESGQASIDLSLTFVDDAVTGVFGEPYDFSNGQFDPLRDSMLGRSVVEVVPGLSAEIQGEIGSDGAIHFGPTVVDDFEWKFSLIPTYDKWQLTGFSRFYGDDGPTYGIEALFIAVPEPGSFGAPLCALVLLLGWKVAICRRC